MRTAPAHPEITLAVSRLARLFAHAWSSEEELQTYAATLADLDPSDVDRACDEIAQRERYWPRPVTIRRAVESVQRRRQPLAERGVPEIYTDEDGVTHQLFACRDCQDIGLIPVDANGAPMSWDQVSGKGDWAGNPQPRRAVRRCTHCGKLAPPKNPTVKPSFEEEGRR